MPRKISGSALGKRILRERKHDMLDLMLLSKQELKRLYDLTEEQADIAYKWLGEQAKQIDSVEKLLGMM